MNGGDIIAGRNFTPIEYAAGARVAVINDKLAQSLFPGRDPIGKTIKIFGEPFQVIGLHAEAASLFSNADEPRLAIPHTDLHQGGGLRARLDGDRGDAPPRSATTLEAQDEVTTALRTTRGLKPGEANNFAIVTQDRLLDAFNKVTAGFFVVMIALSSVGLMVGGVGVVAIMMISVTERTREIGVRKALGATRGEILFQFLVEAATLTLIGCLIGMALGALWPGASARFTPIPATVPLGSVVAAVVASILTGRAVRAVSRQQGVAAGSGGGVEVRVERTEGRRRRGEATHRHPERTRGTWLVTGSSHVRARCLTAFGMTDQPPWTTPATTQPFSVPPSSHLSALSAYL